MTIQRNILLCSEYERGMRDCIFSTSRGGGITDGQSTREKSILCKLRVERDTLQPCLDLAVAKVEEAQKLP